MRVRSQHQLRHRFMRPADGRPPHPSPTQCINNWHRDNGYSSSLELPDSTLNFIKKHPLMEEQVRPRLGRPLLVKKNTNFTHVVADRVTGLDGTTYTVLFIGTGRHFGCARGWDGWSPQGLLPRHSRVLITSPGDGWLLKAVSLGPWIHMIEELQVFDQEPVASLVLSQSKVARWAAHTSLAASNSAIFPTPNLSASWSWALVIGQLRIPHLALVSSRK